MATITRAGFRGQGKAVSDDGPAGQIEDNDADDFRDGSVSQEGLGTQPIHAGESESVSKVIMVNGRRFKTLAEAMRFMSTH